MQQIITIDGPSGSGKGTLARRLAGHLGFHLLDSGALYRILGYQVAQQTDWLDEPDISNAHVDKIGTMAHELDIQFKVTLKGGTDVLLNGKTVSDQIRTEQVGAYASRVASLMPVRSALLEFQRDFYAEPGLVADGRDMGSVVFPKAPLKIYLTADPKIRAERRYDQLRQAGKSASMDAIFRDIVKRDERDTGREHAPLKPAADAVLIDSTSFDANEVFEQARVLAARKLF